MIDTVADEGLVEAAAARGARLRAGLAEIALRRPVVRSLRGRGLLQGIELQDPATGADLPPARRASERAAALAKQRRLMIYAGNAALPDREIDALLLAPPLVITDAEIDEVIERLDGALAALESELAPG